MSGSYRWLDDRRPPMPPELRRAVVEAMGTVSREAAEGARGPAERLAEAGLAVLAEVAHSSPERSTALELLSADALLTFACEAAADAGPDALSLIVADLDYSRFQALLEPTEP